MQDVTRQAFKNGLLEQGEDWMDDKGTQSDLHTHNTAIAAKMVRNIWIIFILHLQVWLKNLLYFMIIRRKICAIRANQRNH